MRFVILRHCRPGPGPPTEHWDLLVDAGGPLRAWALQAEPRAGATVAAVVLPAHRRVFLAYEGPLTGNRGLVSRVETGTCEILEESPEKIEFLLHGQRLQGAIACHVAVAAGAESSRPAPPSLPPLPNFRE